MKSKLMFSHAVIRDARVPEGLHRIELRDRKIPSLVCRVSRSGIKTFSVFKRVNGSLPERITIGRFPSISVEQARRLAEKVNGEIAGGKNPAQLKRIMKGELTFEELFFQFIENHSKIKKKTWVADMQVYKRYLKEPLGKSKLSHIGKSDIYAIFAGLRSKKRLRKKIVDNQACLSGATANRVLALIRAVFNWGISLELCDKNPTAGIKKYKEESRTRFLQADELPKFIYALEQEENPIIKDFIFISLLTGARRSNVLSMCWKDVNLDRKEWTIPVTKNGSAQTVVLSSEAVEILLNRRIVATSEFVFPGTGKKGWFDDPKKGWKRLLERAGIENLKLHDLRRTMGSWQAKTGASLIVIGKSLGHKSLQSTAIYARLDLKPVRESVETATKAMMLAARRKSYKSIFNLASYRKRQTLINFSHLIGQNICASKVS